LNWVAGGDHAPIYWAKDGDPEYTVSTFSLPVRIPVDAAPAATRSHRQMVTALLEASGEVAWIDDESLMDAVTAVSGSGPAYVFWLTECLAEAAASAGLPRDLAGRLARATVSGAGELMNRSTLEPAKLRENVTSPGGTTAEALAVLMADDGLKPLMVKAIAAARRRAGELGS
jgi:pyrroline-5-carboxylate reductase